MSDILIIDDEEAVCWTLRRALNGEGRRVAVAASAEEGLELAAKKKPDAILLDVRLPGLDGLSALAELRRRSGDAPVIVMTAFGNLNTAVRAVEGGAFDYLTKPFDLEQALETVQRALQQRKAAGEPSAPPPETTAGEDIVGASPVMQNVFKRIALVAPRDSCVLITGESGTGKELVARAVHRFSARRDRPFLPVHVAALNPSLVESELFGHLKGAFTGAAQARPGLLSLAEGGTIFFDEIAEIPAAVQVKLLRVLEHNEYFPVGGNQPQKLDVRVLAATHQNLEKKIAEGSFRHDLFFRLNVFQVHVPPLRERREDIPLLADFFLRRLEPRCLPLPPPTVQHLMSQPWLGNVRELRNALEHAVIMARGGPILPEHLPSATTLTGAGPREQLAAAVLAWLQERIRQAAPSPPANLYDELLSVIEPPLLEEVIRRLQGNRWVAAQWLGLNRATVRKKLQAYGLAELFRNGRDDEEAEEQRS
ncbi:MAG: sigma-54 dependent transcriptional regulator [Gemmataceae bacterium]